MVFKKKQPKTEGVVVGGSKRKLSFPDIKKLKNIDWRSKKTKKITVVVMLLCLLLLTGGYMIQQVLIKKKIEDSKPKAGVPAKVVCNAQLNRQSAANFSHKRQKQLKASVESIKKIQSYSQDPNCLIPIIVYSVKTYNISEADQALTTLKTFNTDSYTVDAAYIKSGLSSKGDIEHLVNNLRTNIEKNKQNIRYF